MGRLSVENLISFLGRLGFAGPYSGTKHQFMTKGPLRIRLPNPHRGDISRGLLVKILREAGIASEDWVPL